MTSGESVGAITGVAPVRARAAAGPSNGPLPQAIKGWRDSSTTWIRTNDPDAAATLAARRPPAGPPRLVVIGETNRGKSSLVNALLSTPGLSPVDAGTATCSYLTFVYAATPYAVARFGGGLADVTFPLSDLRTWATVDGEPDVDLPPPRSIEVGVPSELARTLTLVDTPGVGGLVSAHGELAVEASAAADALLFVVDASAPFTRGELDFLAAVGERVDAVHFVVTKIDAYRGWREIVEADRQLLARHAPRFAEARFHPVSSRLAQAAAAQTDDRIRQAVDEQAGITALRSALSAEITAMTSLLAEANIIRTTITVLTGGVAQLETSRRALTAGADEIEALKARREHLMGQRRTGGRSWQVMLRAEIQRARVDLTHETSREVREASQMFRGAIDQADSAELKKLPFHIDAYLQAMTSRAHGRLIDAMGRITHSVLRELFTPEELRILISQLATRPYERLAVRGPDRTRNMDETVMTLGGAGMGFTLSRMLLGLPAMALPAFGIILTPVSIVVGGAAAWYLIRSRRRMSDKQHLKQWLAEVLGEAKAQVDQSIAEQFVDADEQLTLALDDALTRQVAALDAEIKEVDGALKLDATDRATRLRTIDDRTRSATTLMESGEALLQRIRTARATGRVDAAAATAALRPAAQAAKVDGEVTGSRTIVVPPGLTNLIKAAPASQAPAAATIAQAPTAPLATVPTADPAATQAAPAWEPPIPAGARPHRPPRTGPTVAEQAAGVAALLRTADSLDQAVPVSTESADDRVRTGSAGNHGNQEANRGVPGP